MFLPLLPPLLNYHHLLAGHVLALYGDVVVQRGTHEYYRLSLHFSLGSLVLYPLAVGLYLLGGVVGSEGEEEGV